MDDMPVFIIKAKDQLAIAAIQGYRELCYGYGLRDQAAEVQKAIDEMQEWRERNQALIQYPDHKHVSAGES